MHITVKYHFGACKTKDLQHFSVSSLYTYLNLTIIGEVSQGGHNFGHCSSQGLLHSLLLPLGDSGEAW